jgi:hypothetical protein
MTTARFNEILNGALSHPMISLHVSRLALALHFVVNATGDAGDAALEQIAREFHASDDVDGSDLAELEENDSTGSDLLDELADELRPRGL